MKVWHWLRKPLSGIGPPSNRTDHQFSGVNMKKDEIEILSPTCVLFANGELCLVRGVDGRWFILNKAGKILCEFTGDSYE